MKVDVYTEFNKDIKNLWSHFEKSVVITPFQSFAWLNHWQETVGNPLLDVQPQIVHLQNHGQTFAILPLCIRKKYGITILEWLGGISTDYMGPLVKNDIYNILPNKQIWSNVKQNLKSFDVIHFQKQEESAIQFLDNIGLSATTDKTLKAYKATLQQNWDEYFAQVKKKIRSDSMRQRRRLEKIDKLSFIYAKNSKEKNEIIQSMITEKSKRYRETGVWDMLAINEYQCFYQGLVDISSDQCKVHCSSLKIGDVTIATHVGLVDNDTFYYLMPAHKIGEWEKYSPGRLLLLELLKWSIENGLKIFDFTIGGEVYKKNWCNINFDLFECLKPITIKGKIFLLRTKSIQGIKRIKWIGNKVRQFRTWKKNK